MYVALGGGGVHVMVLAAVQRLGLSTAPTTSQQFLSLRSVGVAESGGAALDAFGAILNGIRMRHMMLSSVMRRAANVISADGPPSLCWHCHCVAQQSDSPIRVSNSSSTFPCLFSAYTKSALQLVREIHHSASTHCTWRNADTIGSHLLDCVAIAVQRCTGMALRASVERETTRALGARAA